MQDPFSSFQGIWTIFSSRFLNQCCVWERQHLTSRAELGSSPESYLLKSWQKPWKLSSLRLWSTAGSTMQGMSKRITDKQIASWSPSTLAASRRGENWLSKYWVLTGFASSTAGHPLLKPKNYSTLQQCKTCKVVSSLHGSTKHWELNMPSLHFILPVVQVRNNILP